MLAFKGFQFVTTGLIPGIIGVVLFIRCVVLVNPNDPNVHTCSRSGPAADAVSSLTFVIDIVGFVLQVCDALASIS